MGSKYPLDRRPGASDFSVGPVNSQPHKSSGLVFFHIKSLYDIFNKKYAQMLPLSLIFLRTSIIKMH